MWKKHANRCPRFHQLHQENPNQHEGEVLRAERERGQIKKLHLKSNFELTCISLYNIDVFICIKNMVLHFERVIVKIHYILSSKFLFVPKTWYYTSESYCCNTIYWAPSNTVTCILAGTLRGALNFGDLIFSELNCSASSLCSPQNWLFSP